MTNQLQLVSLGVLVKIFSKPEIASSVEDEREGVVWCGVDPDERSNVRVGKLAAH